MASLIPERSQLYDMIRGYFDVRKIDLNAIPCLGLLAPNRYELDLSKDMMYELVEQGASKLQAPKVCADWESNPGRLESSNLLHTIVFSDPKSKELGKFS